jgi:hypothetical protein
MEVEGILFKNRKIFLFFADYCNDKYRSGHDLNLYRDIIKLHRSNDNLDILLNQHSFYELIMETLRAWNMDQQGAELASVNDFKESVQSISIRSALNLMYPYKLYNIDRRNTIEQIADTLKHIFCNLNDLNLTAGRYKPYVHEEIVYPEPKAIIAEVMEIEDRINAGLKHLINKIR